MNGKINGTTNGTSNGTVNGTTNARTTIDDTSTAGTKRKRPVEDPMADPGSAQKIQKVASLSKEQNANGVDSVFIEDSTDGAIVIDDD